MSTFSPHTLTIEEEEYVKQLDDQGKRLHELAIEKLESSYFVKRTHGFKTWLAKKQNQQETVITTTTKPK
jgi:hypothetical protein